MTEQEIKTETVKNEKWTVSDDFKNFLLTILASFLGCLVALCLYSAATKPPAKPCPMPPLRFEAPRHHGIDAARPPKGDFRPDRARKHHEIKAPDAERLQAPAKEASKAKTPKAKA